MKTKLLIAVSFLVLQSAIAQISSKEKQALIAIYNTTNGKNWTTTWDLTAPVTSWYGVKLKNDTVVEINLTHNNLEGTLPKEIGNLTHLEKLRLGFNALEGVIPTTIKNLKQLTALELFMNRFGGNIPNEVGELKNLRVLHLYCNKFLGEIPASITQLVNLEELLLGSNFLMGHIPTDIGRLLKLKKLSLIDNQLDGGIPQGISQLVNLEEFVLSAKDLSGEISGTLTSNLKSINTLVISPNNTLNEVLQYSGNDVNSINTSTAILDIEKE